MGFRHSLLQHIIFPLADRFMHTSIMRYYSLINKMNQWSPSEIQKWQTDNINKLITHFYNNSTYYRSIMDDRGLEPDDIVSIDDLRKLPVLTKEIIINHQSELIPKNIDNIYHQKNSTGGSTGDPMQFLQDLKSWSFINAHYFYQWNKVLKYNIGDKYIALGSSSLFPTNKMSYKHKIYYNLKGKIPLNGINLSDHVIDSYINFINKMRISYIYGYASSIYLLAKYVLEKNPIVVPIMGCISTSEILLPQYRETIKRAFACDVLDAYGAGDGGITAFEVSEGHYHVGYNCLVEVTEASFDKQSGKLLATDLLNYAFPFIRYQIGDEGSLLDKESAGCNSYNGQVLTKIFGRTPDIMRLENGRILTAPGFTILFKDLNVREYQIRKTKNMTILCNIKKGSGYTIDQEYLIINTIKKQAGDDCKVIINYVEQFEQTLSGKKRYFICDDNFGHN